MTMKAIILKGFGGVENLVMADLPMPEISDNEVIVKVKAIGINPIDIKTRKGKGLAGALKDFDPLIPGLGYFRNCNQDRRESKLIQ